MTENITERLIRCLHWVIRFRHRCGYGIHSPFAFGFVTGVVYECGEYYAYAELNKRYTEATHKHLRCKDYRLMFRVINFQRPKGCLICGLESDDLALRFLRAGSRHTHYVTLHANETPDAESVDMAVVNGMQGVAAEKLMQRLRPGGLLVVVGLKNAADRRAWKKLIASVPQAQVSFDLRDFGFVFYRPELQREHYVINYF